jgi:hypothetical protein
MPAERVRWWVWRCTCLCYIIMLLPLELHNAIKYGLQVVTRFWNVLSSPDMNIDCASSICVRIAN